MKTNKYIHIGKRANQEDALGFEQNLFVICDGVGGRILFGNFNLNLVVGIVKK